MQLELERNEIPLHLLEYFDPVSRLDARPKNLASIPWRVALALQADGWTLRSDIIWAKPNPMPESVTDRPTKAHEYVFLLTKSARYYWDAEAVREPHGSEWIGRTIYSDKGNKDRNDNGRAPVTGNLSGRNIRTVWSIATAPYEGAHYAVWPPALVERMIRAGTSERGVCSHRDCGAPWRRVVEKGEAVNRPDNPNDVQPYAAGSGHSNGNGATTLHKTRAVETVEWRPSCGCNIEGVPLRPDDLELISTPTGERVGDDPSLVTGRAGMNRPRGEAEGVRPITRYAQRAYAAQLRNSPHRAEMEAEAGPPFAHYIRTDSTGARPVPDALLQTWLDRGWLERVSLPQVTPYPAAPAIVLDPFCGSGTTLLVARRLGRIGLGFDLSETYLRDNAAVRLGHDKLAAWGRGIVDTGDYSDLFRAATNGHGATEKE